MYKSEKSPLFVLAIGAMLIGGFLIANWSDPSVPCHTISARASKNKERGEYGGDLSFLKRFHLGPQTAGESNHYIDLWSPGALATLTRINGLTNNRALFVDSHAKAGFLWHGLGYGLYPRKTLLRANEETSYFSVRDLARMLGQESAAGIHNIVVGGCNEEGRFRSQEWRRHFVNATNITYMTPGKLAFKPMFYQAIVTPSSAIQQLYGKIRRTSNRVECDIENASADGTEPLGVYVADLFLPGACKPYCTQRGGRELLKPE